MSFVSSVLSTRASTKNPYMEPEILTIFLYFRGGEKLRFIRKKIKRELKNYKSSTISILRPGVSKRT